MQRGAVNHHPSMAPWYSLLGEIVLYVLSVLSPVSPPLLIARSTSHGVVAPTDRWPLRVHGAGVCTVHWPADGGRPAQGHAANVAIGENVTGQAANILQTDCFHAPAPCLLSTAGKEETDSIVTESFQMWFTVWFESSTYMLLQRFVVRIHGMVRLLRYWLKLTANTGKRSLSLHTGLSPAS